MVPKLSIVLFMFPSAFLSKSTCEDDNSFLDSFGWTCRDYGRVPEQCMFSKKYEINGKMALTSCCVCKNYVNTPGNVVEHFGMSFLDHFSKTRRQSETCLEGCSGDKETCSDSCDSEKNTCKTHCDDVESTCFWQCELVEEDEEEEGAGGVVETEDEDVTSSWSSSMEWYIILLIVLLVLGLICCFLVIVYFMQNHVKVGVAGSSPNVNTEQAPMVPNKAPMVPDTNYAREVEQYYRPRPQAQYDNDYDFGRRNVPAYYN